MSEIEPTNGKDRADYVEVGDNCPIHRCNKTIGDGHWVVFPSGFHAYHTDKERTARRWQEGDGMNAVPTLEPYKEGTLGHLLYGGNDTDN